MLCFGLEVFIFDPEGSNRARGQNCGAVDIRRDQRATDIESINNAFVILFSKNECFNEHCSGFSQLVVDLLDW